MAPLPPIFDMANFRGDSGDGRACFKSAGEIIGCNGVALCLAEDAGRVLQAFVGVALMTKEMLALDI